MLEKCDTKGHNFERHEVGILECELCHRWVASRAEDAKELQTKIDKLGECHMANKSRELSEENENGATTEEPSTT